MSTHVEVSVLLPAYNEEAIIEDTIDAAFATLESFLADGTYEVIIAENGSTDDTLSLVESLAANEERLRVVHTPEGGRGAALEDAFEAAAGGTVVYFDADLATDMKHLEELVESIRTEGYDVVTGSRWMKQNEADRPMKRSIPSKGFNFLARTVLGSDLRDHQCGFKAFDRDAVLELAGEVEDDHWFWDTEVLVLAQRHGFRVKEFPVDWTPKGDSKLNLVRDILGMGSQVVRCFWQWRVQPRLTRRVNIASGFLLVLLTIVAASYYLEFSQLLEALKTANPTLLLAASAVYALSLPIRGYRYQQVLDRFDVHEGVWFLTGAVCISQTANFVVPARTGDAVRAYIMKARRGVSYSTGFASLAIERLFDLSIITVLAGMGLLGVVVNGNATLSELARITSTSRTSGRFGIVVAGTIGVIALLGMVAIIVTARRDVSLTSRLTERLGSGHYADAVADVITRFGRDIQLIGRQPAIIPEVGSTSLTIWGIDVLTALLVLLAYGVSVPLETLLAVGFLAICVGNLAKILPLTPGGIGLYEGVFAVLFITLTPVTWSIALSAAIVDHVIKNGLTVLSGLISTVKLNMSLISIIESDDAGVKNDTSTE